MLPDVAGQSADDDVGDGLAVHTRSASDGAGFLLGQQRRERAHEATLAGAVLAGRLMHKIDDPAPLFDAEDDLTGQ